MVSVQWTVVSIFLGTITVLLGWVVHGIISKGFFHGEVGWRVLITLLGIVAICIVIVLALWVKRVGFQVWVNNYRMREIENELGMLKNLTVYWLDHPEETPQEQEERRKKALKSVDGKTYKTGSEIARRLFILVGVLWVIAIGYAWLSLILDC